MARVVVNGICLVVGAIPIDQDIERDENDPIVQWMEFLDAKSKGVMGMLAENNKNIKKAY